MMTRVNGELMTPQQVRSATFSSARFGRRGLDEGEVQGFCELVAQGLGRLLNDNNLLQAEIVRLRERLLDGKGNSGVQSEDGHLQAVYMLSKAQQTADRYVADAQEYSREIAEDARARRDEILREAKMRASMILEEAHSNGSEAAYTAREDRDPIPESERQELQAEITYLRTFSDVCRTHLRAYMESLARFIEEWERTERGSSLTAREPVSEEPVREEPVREEPVGEPARRESVGEPVREEPVREEPVGEPARRESVGEPVLEESIGEPVREEPVREESIGEESVRESVLHPTP